ncbi:MAG: hypothetical protein ACTSRG_13445 [Candidatus Helarchaeota archaeon]
MGEKNSGTSNVIPFITTVVNDIYDKINGLQESLKKVGTIFVKMNDNFKETAENIGKSVTEMLEESRMNRDLALEAFSDSMNALLTKIQEIQDEKGKATKKGEMESILNRLDDLSNKLNEKYWDIQLMLTTSNLHTLIDILKGESKVINVLMPAQATPTPQIITSPKPALVPAPTKTAATTEAKEDIFAKSPKFKGGRKVKTHDDRLEEMKRKKKLFGKY